jgi:hypothetical protein
MSTADANSRHDPIIPARRTKSRATAAVGFGAQAAKEKPIGYAALFADLGITGHVLTHHTVIALNARSTGAREEMDDAGRVRTMLPGRTAHQGRYRTEAPRTRPLRRSVTVDERHSFHIE